jgi:hypothetical protein
MKRSTLFFDPQRRALPSARVAMAAVAAGLALGTAWHLSAADDAAPAAADRAATPVPALPPATGMATAAPLPGVPVVQPVPAATVAPLTRDATAPPAVPLSREVAPGMHVTPMTLPPGATVAQPAGPTAHDSEPEN